MLEGKDGESLWECTSIVLCMYVVCSTVTHGHISQERHRNLVCAGGSVIGCLAERPVPTGTQRLQ